MDSIFVKTIEIRDDKNSTLYTFDATNSGIKKLCLQYNLKLEQFQRYISSKDNSTSTVSKNLITDFILLTEALCDAFTKFNIWYLVKDEDGENIISNFYDELRRYDTYFVTSQFDFDTNPKNANFLTQVMMRYSDFSSTSYYQLVDAVSPEYYDYKTFNLYSLLPIEDNNLDEDEDEDSIIDDFLNDNIDGDEEVEKNPNNYDYELELSFPVHKTMISEIEKTILVTYDLDNMIYVDIYWKLYKQYLDFKNMEQEYVNNAKHLEKILAFKIQSLKKKCPSFDNLYKYRYDNIDTRYRTEESMFNTPEIFIKNVLNGFLERNDIRFFDDLRHLFKACNKDDKFACMYFVKEFSDILERYKLDKELRCLKHIVNDDNVVDFVQFLYHYFDIVVNSLDNHGLFGNNFTIDISDLGRNNG